MSQIDHISQIYDVRTIINWIYEKKIPLTVILLSLLFFSLGFLLRNQNPTRFPDEYYYLWTSNPEILENLSYREYEYLDINVLISSVRKLGFILILSSYFQIIGCTCGITIHVISLLFYSMLIPVTFLIGTIINNKTGIVSAIFIGVNPIIWFWNSRLMPDILYSVICISFFYFFFQTFRKRSKVNKKYLIPTLILGFLSYTQQPKMIFTWGLALGFFFITTIKRKTKNEKFLLFLIFTVIFIFGIFFLGVVIFFPWFFEYDFQSILNRMIEMILGDLGEWNNLFSPDKEIWYNIAYPNYYTYSIIFLFFLGLFPTLEIIGKRKFFFIILSLSFTIFFHITAYSNYGARFSFLVFPLIMVIASVGLLKSDKRNIIFFILFLISLPIIFTWDSPQTPTFPESSFIPNLISFFIVFIIISYKTIEAIVNLRGDFRENKYISKLSKIFTNEKGRSIFLILISVNCLLIGISIVTNENYPRNDYISDSQRGLPQAGNWLKENIPSNSIILTNIRAHILSYYMGCTYDIVDEDLNIDRKNHGEIITPKDKQEFDELVDNKKVDYMVVFSDKLIGEFWKRSFFLPYKSDEKLFTVYKLGNEKFSMNITESTENWSKTYGDLNITLDPIEKKDVNFSIRVNGTTDQYDNRSRIHNEGNWQISEFFEIEFWFKLKNATNPYYFSTILIDNMDNYIYWNSEDEYFNNWNSGDWVLFNLNSNDRSGTQGDFNSKQIKIISIYLYANSKSYIYYNIDGFNIYNNIDEIYSF